jgi:DNA-binding transcriptional LysR family regulator
MDRVEARELAYFVAVAEELHFGRAAQRLHMAQPPLSRAIAGLERRIGVALLRRTSRKVELTDAGEVLLREARKALSAIDAAIRRAERAGDAEQRLVVVTKPGGDAGMLPAVLDAYRREEGSVRVDVAVCGVGEAEAALRDGRADAGFLSPSHDDLAGLDTEELLTQPRVLVVPRDHPLANRAVVAVADLEGLPMARLPGATWVSGVGPPIRDSAQLMTLIGLGQVVAVLPRSALDQLHRDLVGVPVLDALPATTVLAWPEGTETPALAGLVRAARKVASTRTIAQRQTA